ncbi:ThuA domain-containing protein [Telluria mixta]|uniref:ThuA domain-containing protein n=1 Tax=Telluria mixta TaxID=34071 RepID=A0ABT2C077_9BURK|nr:ThuA domain-containing protein [Telluria mixta]MCS0630256.1 ThuA domain-containing protein [Telluria mixta]WEM94435.1 ThuA domain-containing protein [Telluria mixta]
MRTRRAWCIGISLALLSLHAAGAPEGSAPSGVFKGTWAGPSVRKLPGPGPAPGESLEHYFANLKTGPRTPARKHVLVLGGARKFQHDSIPTAMASVYAWGEATGAWDAELRTDFTLVADRGGVPMNAGFQPKGLRDFDAVVIASADGEWELAPDQKRALLDFVRAGKGLVVMHAGIDANHQWRDYLDMIGAEQVGHPYNTVEHPIRSFTLLNEGPDAAPTRQLPRRFGKQDELYTLRNWTRSDIDVLLRIDDTTVEDVGDDAPPDRDLPVAWIKTYGTGRVFASTLGHTREAYKDPDIARMYATAIEWALGLVDGPVVPHARPARR